jgi:polysaccharide export outer membrane protein
VSLFLVLPLPALSADDYVVGTEDVLKITVYNHPDLTTTERVSGEGKITLPLIGEIRVADMTTDKVAKEIAARLADGYIVDPNVSVLWSSSGARRRLSWDR